MARLNKIDLSARPRTHEGAVANPPKNALHELRRAVASCLLWEDQFYESGVDIATRIADLTKQCPAEDVATLAIEARTQMKLRHAPLWLLSSLLNNGRGPKASFYPQVINRADEMGELIAMFWQGGKRPLPSAMKRGIAQAFGKFDAYQLGKYDRKVAVKLRDVIRLVHPKPANDEQSAMWKQLIDGTLPAPDTWEVALSTGGDKKATFERLLREGKLGYMALLRNLRGMIEAQVDTALIKEKILARKGAHMVLPFRFISAVKHAPMFARELDAALVDQISDMPVLEGQTAVLVDTSGSMSSTVSGKSELARWEAAAALASIVNGDVRLYHFGDTCKEVPAYRGLAGVDVVRQNRGQCGHGTQIGAAVRHALKGQRPARVIVVTDMQSHDSVADLPTGVKGYMINVASYRNGVGFGGWTHIDGFSESTLRFIAEMERQG